MMPNWNERMMDLARLCASWSKDSSTKVGCVLFDTLTHGVVAQGFNGFARRVREDVPGRTERPLKMKYTVHAEINAIVNAAIQGVSTRGLGMACTFFPCVQCASAAIQAGIAHLVVPETDFEHERWGEDFRISRSILDEAGMKVTYLIKAVAVGDTGTEIVEVTDYSSQARYGVGDHVLFEGGLFVCKYPTTEGTPPRANEMWWDSKAMASEPKPWDEHEVYLAGDKVTFLGRTFESRLGAQNGFHPAIYPNQWNCIRGAPFDTIFPWQENVNYRSGEMCSWMGLVYVAKHLTRSGLAPNEDKTFWKVVE